MKDTCVSVFCVTNNLGKCPKTLQQQSPGLPFAKSLCKTEVSFRLHMVWLGVLSLLKNIIYHHILIKTNAFYISGMVWILCREMKKDKGCAVLICFTESVYNLKKVRKEHPVLHHLPSTLLVTDCEHRHHINIERGDDFSFFQYQRLTVIKYHFHSLLVSLVSIFQLTRRRWRCTKCSLRSYAFMIMQVYA